MLQPVIAKEPVTDSFLLVFLLIDIKEFVNNKTHS
jgi:hypothetical protein